MPQSLVGNLGSGQQLFLEQSSNDTLITLTHTLPGQQQSQRSRFSTGAWTQTPVLLQTAIGWVVRLETEQGNFTVQIQGTAIQLLASELPISGTAMPLQPHHAPPAMPPLRPLEPLPPLSPLPPLEMDKQMGKQMGKQTGKQTGNPEMQMSPMTMRMENLAMQMGYSSAETPPEKVSEPDRRAKFCSQCGQAVQPEDKFCSQCGHSLRESGR